MNLKPWIAGLALTAGAWMSASAMSYTFNVGYAGAGNATLAAGSDNPVGTTLFDGDDFNWTIQAQGADTWQVATGGDFFPLMAFGVAESGERIGDFTLVLRRSGADVFTLSETMSRQEEVHVGTNTVSLGTGLVFDEMSLVYTLTSSRELQRDAADPLNPQPIGATLQGLLPIFGAPEQNPFFPGIIYAPVPEPQAAALLLLGLAGLGLAGRRRSKATA